MNDKKKQKLQEKFNKRYAKKQKTLYKKALKEIDRRIKTNRHIGCHAIVIYDTFTWRGLFGKVYKVTFTLNQVLTIAEKYKQKGYSVKVHEDSIEIY